MTLRRMALVVGTVFLLMYVAGCIPARYGSYKPTPNEPAMTLKAERSISGWTKLLINGKEVVAGQSPAFGSEEFRGQYEGHDVLMVLADEVGSKQGELGKRCTVLIDGAAAADFTW